MPIVVTTQTPQAPTTDSVSLDGRLRATVMPGTAGVFLRVDYRDVLGDPGYTWPNPFRVTVWRELADGSRAAVRGAEAMHQYGGVMHAYDDEVTFGQQVSYWAEAPTRDGSEIVETGRVAVLTWEPDGGFTSPGVWIKNLENPDFSVPARCIDWSAGSWASRNATADIWGGSSPAVVTDVRKSYNTKMTVLTADEDEYQALLQAVQSSVVYVVGLERHRRRTGYYLVGDIAPTRVGKPNSPYDSWDIALTGMNRPKTNGHSLVVPGRSYRDRRLAYETYNLIPYASQYLRVTANADASFRVFIDSSKRLDVIAGATYRYRARIRLTAAAAARNLRLGINFWDASNTPLTNAYSSSYNTAPGETADLELIATSPTGVKAQPYAYATSGATNDCFDLISASLENTAAPGVELLAPENTGFSGDMTTAGDWNEYSNATGILVPGARRTYAAGTEPY